MVRRDLAATGLILTAAALCASAQDAPEKNARSLYLKGRYVEAAECYGEAAATDPAAAIGLAQCRLATGRRDEAQQSLVAAAAAFPKSADVQAQLALLALGRGDHEAAAPYVVAALGLDKDCVAARWVDAELHRLAGRLPEA